MEEIKIQPKKIILNIIFVILLSVFALFLISLLFHKASIKIWLKAVQPRYLLLTLGLIIFEWFLEAVRIQRIIHALGNKITFPEILKITLIGSFFAKITPFDTGGEPFEIYLLHTTQSLSLGESTAVIMIKTLMGHFARLSLGIVLPFLVIFFWHQWFLSKTASIVVNIGLFIYLFFVFFLLFITFKPDKAKRFITYLINHPFFPRFHPKKIERWLTRLSHTIDDFNEAKLKLFKTKTKDMIIVAGYSLLCWISIIFVPVAVLWGMGIHSPILEVIAVMAIFYLASAYAPTPGSSGAAELGFATLFSLLVPHTFLGIFVIIWRLLTYYTALFVGGMLTFKEIVSKKLKLKSPPKRDL